MHEADWLALAGKVDRAHRALKASLLTTSAARHPPAFSETLTAPRGSTTIPAPCRRYGGRIANELGQLVIGSSVNCLAGRAFPRHVGRSPSLQE